MRNVYMLLVIRNRHKTCTSGCLVQPACNIDHDKVLRSQNASIDLLGLP